jgi:NAD(P)-dependent dehydrogenase (short-subunit alcohol dehydrogenase family)
MRRSVIISGAGSGIGRAIAIKLSELNFDCYLLGRNNVHLQKTLIGLKDGDHYILNADIKNKDSLANTLSLLRRPVDALIANAGIGGENQWGDNDRWSDIIETNLTGTYQFIQTFLPSLKSSSNNYKHIVMTSSVLARLGVANYSAYCASKAGLLGLMRSMAIEYATDNILVNAICPGWVNTQMSRDGMDGIAKGIGVSTQEFYDIAMQQVPLRKMSEPSEIADIVAYLLFQQSITGQTLDINNGSIMNS